MILPLFIQEGGAMDTLFATSELSDLFFKIEQGIRLNYEDGLRLMKSNDILALGYMANVIRERKHGANTYYSVHGDTLSSFPANDKRIAIINYGEVLDPEQRVKKILEIRSIQDCQHSFTGCFPIAHNTLPGSTTPTTGFDDLRILATARILLDNIEHIQASVAVLGIRLAQVSLNFGVDELVMPPALMSSDDLERIIERANRRPIRRDKDPRNGKDAR